MRKSRTGKEKAGVKVAGSPAASAKTGRESSAWPSSCVYLTSLVWGDDVRRAKDVYKKYKRSADGKHVEASAAATKRNVRWQLITDERHPAKGEYGLFAQRKLERGEHVIDYLGLVTLKGNESKTSDYTASFGDDNELALDAERMGNEARMINDFRNTGRRANALFDQYRDAAGDLKLGVFAGPHGIPKGDEVLVSYGKGFWENRLASMGADDMAQFCGYQAPAYDQ